MSRAFKGAVSVRRRKSRRGAFWAIRLHAGERTYQQHHAVYQSHPYPFLLLGRREAPTLCTMAYLRNNEWPFCVWPPKETAPTRPAALEAVVPASRNDANLTPPGSSMGSANRLSQDTTQLRNKPPDSIRLPYVVLECTDPFSLAGFITGRFSAATSNASIATCHAVVSCSDLGRVIIYCLASSSVRSVLPSGKTIGQSKC
jgi:hypothetical protein